MVASYIVNLTLWNKLLWNVNQNTKLCIQEIVYENNVCKMLGIFLIQHIMEYDLNHNDDRIACIS